MGGGRARESPSGLWACFQSWNALVAQGACYARPVAQCAVRLCCSVAPLFGAFASARGRNMASRTGSGLGAARWPWSVWWAERRGGGVAKCYARGRCVSWLIRG